MPYIRDRQHLPHRKAFTLVSLGLLFLLVRPVSAQQTTYPTAPPVGGKTGVYLDTSSTDQKKTGSLDIGTGATCANGRCNQASPHLCLNALNDTSPAQRDAHCIATWSEIPANWYTTGLVNLHADKIPAGRETDVGQYSPTQIDAVRILGQGTVKNTIQVSSGFDSTTAVGLYIGNNGDAYSTSAAIDGALVIMDHVINNQTIQRKLCLNNTVSLASNLNPTCVSNICVGGGRNGLSCASSLNCPSSSVGCISDWSDIPNVALQSYVKLQQGTAPVAQAGSAAAQNTASFASLTFGTPAAGTPVNLTCGNGICDATESSDGNDTQHYCAVDCDTVSPLTSPTNFNLTAGNEQVSVQMTTTATHPSGSRYVLLVRSDTQPAFAPQDGVIYSANTLISNSTILFAGLVNASTVLNYADSGRQNGTQYFYDVYQANTYPRYSTKTELSATPTPGSVPQYTLSVTVSNPSIGSVTSSDGTINCGLNTPNICSGQYASGTTIHLTEHTAYTFVGWSTGDCLGITSPNCDITMTNINKSQQANFSNSGGGGCFIAGTSVDTPQGAVPIEDIKVGQMVYAFDEADQQVVIRPVTAALVHPDNSYGRVTLADGTVLNVTPVHRFYLPESKSWAAIRQLHIGDIVLRGRGLNAHPVAIRSLQWAVGTTTVYNLTVQEFHNYFVNGVLVHNFKTLEE